MSLTNRKSKCHFFNQFVYSRCVFTTINPESGVRHPDREPLKTLLKNRRLIPNEDPVMGLNMALRNPGTISIGDAVYVNDDS